MKKLFFLLSIIAFSFSACSSGDDSPSTKTNTSTTGGNTQSGTGGSASAQTGGYTDDTKR